MQLQAGSLIGAARRENSSVWRWWRPKHSTCMPTRVCPYCTTFSDEDGPCLAPPLTRTFCNPQCSLIVVFNPSMRAWKIDTNNPGKWAEIVGGTPGARGQRRERGGEGGSGRGREGAMKGGREGGKEGNDPAISDAPVSPSHHPSCQSISVSPLSRFKDGLAGEGWLNSG